MSTWGILGCGTIANEMAATFQKMGHEIYGVANRTPEKAEKFADKYGVKHVFKTYEEMLADENIDIIYVATPHSICLLYTSPSPRDYAASRMPSSA